MEHKKAHEPLQRMAKRGTALPGWKAWGIRLIGFPSEYNLIIKAGLVLVILVLQSPRISAEWRLWRDSHRASREATQRRQA